VSERFTRKWREAGQTPLHTKIKATVRPTEPLKPRLDDAIRRIELHIQRLEKATDRFSERDKSLFARIVKAYERRDLIRANVFAAELTEMRKMEKMIVHARLALEQIVLRLRTVSELGDAVSTLAPTVNVLRSVKKGISGIMPAASSELEQIGNLLNGIMLDAGHSSELNINFEATDDAHKILNEAAATAEQKIKEELPNIPFEIHTEKKKAVVQT
jgi:division protein CdvB (Snf7/Vps24/ESCRT-III family)